MYADKLGVLSRKVCMMNTNGVFDERDGISGMMAECVGRAMSIIFEDAEVQPQTPNAGVPSNTSNPQQQQASQPIPVNAQNVVNSQDAKTLPAQLVAAQGTAEKLAKAKADVDALQKVSDEQVSKLRDTLAVSSEGGENATASSSPVPNSNGGNAV